MRIIVVEHETQPFAPARQTAGPVDIAPDFDTPMARGGAGAGGGGEAVSSESSAASAATAAVKSSAVARLANPDGLQPASSSVPAAKNTATTFMFASPLKKLN